MTNKYIIKELSSKTILSGIYKINFPNGKSYIGMSNNIRKRMLSHNELDYKRKYILGYAINKYGPIEEFEVVEFIDPNNRALMSEREKYWIAYYNTLAPNGYNKTAGGEGLASSGCDSGSAKFDEKTLKEVINILMNNPEIAITDLAKQYSVAPSTIYNINEGHSYYNSKLSYPIRNKELKGKAWAGTKSSSSKLSNDQILEIYLALLLDVESQVDIAKRYNVSPSTIGLINKGTCYHNDKVLYPIRKNTKPGKKKKTFESS